MANDNKDQALLEIFLEEATDLVASLSSTLRQWEAELSNLGKIADLKRDLHTMKGSARMVGQTAIGNLAHEMETLTESLAKGQIPVERGVFDLVVQGLDLIELMVEALKKHQTLPNTENLIQKFHAYLPQIAKKEASQEEKLSETNPEVKTAKTPEKGDEKTQAAASLGAEIVRIRAALLQTLNNLSTENSMIRVGLEQQIVSFGIYLREMKQESRRLEVQLNSLGLEIQSYSENTDAIIYAKTAADQKEIEQNRYSTLEQMNNVIKETATDVVNILKNLNETHALMETLLLNQARISTELQHRLTDTRLVPFESIVPRLSRIARQVSSEINKKIDFKVLKSEGEMDRTVLEHLVPSLEHILRNSIDHGIEPSDVRQKSGKPETGKIEVSFIRTGSTAAIEVKDDGGGIDSEAVRRKAINVGLLSKDAVLSDEEVIRYILEPGFSTREAVTQLSGRGVGMDVVNSAVTKMGGNLSISSKKGVGTKMIIRFPFTASLNRILMFKMQREIYGMLLTNVERVSSVSMEELRKLLLTKNSKYEHGGKSYAIHYLASLLEFNRTEINIPKKKTFPIILYSGSDYPIAIVVDSILYSREFIVHALGPQLKLTNEYSGATLLGDGRAVLILDLFTLSQNAKSAAEREMAAIQFSKSKIVERTGQPLVMVVDDSISARTITKRLLERHQYQVMTAKDGLDALQKLDIQLPDVILSDIDMPRMDGFEFASSVRREDKYKNIPIIIITSRASNQYKLRAEELKLNGFLEKPFKDDELLHSIHTVLGKQL